MLPLGCVYYVKEVYADWESLSTGYVSEFDFQATGKVTASSLVVLDSVSGGHKFTNRLSNFIHDCDHLALYFHFRRAENNQFNGSLYSFTFYKPVAVLLVIVAQI